MTAAREGHFWDFAGFILDHQDSLREQDLIAYSRALVWMKPTLQDDSAAPIRSESRRGSQCRVAAGHSRSPVVFVNGKRIDGVPSLQALVTTSKRNCPIFREINSRNHGRENQGIHSLRMGALSVLMLCLAHGAPAQLIRTAR